MIPSADPEKAEDYPDDFLRGLFETVRMIAVVGLSPDPARPSHYVCAFLQQQGYRTVGVNPGQAGNEILGAPVYARLADIPFPIDMVDIFRNADAAAEVVDDALALTPMPKVIWMQLDVRNDAAAQKARAQDVNVVMNRCPKLEYPRLFASRAAPKPG